MKCLWVGLCALIVLVAVPVTAERPFTEASLDGAYSTSGIWVRSDEATGEPAYCSGYGTITFDGDGTGQMENTQLCSDSSAMDPTTDPVEEITYAITGPRTFLITTVSMPTDTRCEFLQKGTIIMCDGTERGEDLYALHFMAVKR